MGLSNDGVVQFTRLLWEEQGQEAPHDGVDQYGIKNISHGTDCWCDKSKLKY